MKKKTFFKILTSLFTIVTLLFFFTILYIKPRIAKKIRAALNESNSSYIVEIDNVFVSIFPSRIGLETITIRSKQDQESDKQLNGEIASVKINGVNLYKIIFRNDLDIDEVIISNSNINGVILFEIDSIQPLISGLNIQIDKILFEKINLSVKDAASAQTYSVKEGWIKVYDLQILRDDTISSGIVNQFDFTAEELLSVTPDSMYTISAVGINLSETLNTLLIDTFFIHPNYSDNDFTLRNKFQTDRIEAGFSDVSCFNFSASGFLKSESLVCTYIEIGKMEMDVFRDRRREFKHVTKPMFQEMLYGYPGKINIDSIIIKSGSVNYTEHAEKTEYIGTTSFKEIGAEIFRVSNDTVLKKKEPFLELRSSAFLMGQGKLNILMKAKLFDDQNTFSMSGTLSEMEFGEVNPMLRANAFVFVKSGKLDEMRFNFIANDFNAKGRMTMLYHGLEISGEDAGRDHNESIKEKIVSFIANMKAMDSNPLPGDQVRVGVIDFNRDKEKFIFNYCFKSILSGVKSSIITSESKKKRN